jgi:hypothetical protein
VDAVLIRGHTGQDGDLLIQPQPLGDFVRRKGIVFVLLVRDHQVRHPAFSDKDTNQLLGRQQVLTIGTVEYDGVKTKVSCLSILAR